MRFPFISLIVLSTIGGTVWAEVPFFRKVDLFQAGKDGYALYRIPGIVTTGKGTLLAYCEARKNAGGDWGQIDILIRRSTDNGQTWEPAKMLPRFSGKVERNPAAVAQKLGKPDEVTYNNPVAIADSKTGAVHFLYCIEYGRCFYLKSEDDGQTFSDPREITDTFDRFRPDYDWKVLATGPGHGIQLMSGRLLVPVWLSTGTGGHAHRPSCVASIFSDDHGKTWQRGSIVVNHPTLKNPSETIAVQFPDGRVYFNIRHEDGPQGRAFAFSPDGAKDWSKPVFDARLPEPICMASIVRYPHGDKSMMLFANPDNPVNRERKNVTVRLSDDDAKTWKVKRAIEPGPSGYSDLAVGKGGLVHCFYERGSGQTMYQTRFLTVASFNLEWVAGKTK